MHTSQLSHLQEALHTSVSISVCSYLFMLLMTCDLLINIVSCDTCQSSIV